MSLIESEAAGVTRRGGASLAAEIAEIRRLERELAAALRDGTADRLPGNAAFLNDGRVLCRERDRGDSRYPYGRDGFHFWVNASGLMSANHGLFYVFLPTQAGHEPQVAFFVGRAERGGGFLPIPLLPTPLIPEAERIVTDRYTVIGHDAAYFMVETPELFGAVRVYCDQSADDAIDLAFSIHLENRGDAVIELYQSTYMNPFCRHQFSETSEDRWFKRVQVVGDERTGSPSPLLIATNEDVSRFRSITHRALVRRAWTCETPTRTVCTSRLGYMGGPRAGLAQADCLRSGAFARETQVTVFNDNAIVGDMNRFRLDANQTARFDVVMSLLSTRAAYTREVSAAIKADSVDAALAHIRDESDRRPRQLAMKLQGCRVDGVREGTLNAFFPFLVRQVEVCAKTHGFMQPSPNSLIGIRDVFQAIEGLLYDDRDAARRKILEALEYVLIDGRCPRQYSLPVNGTPGKADLRCYIDQGAWVISALHTYVSVTGDAALLDVLVGYHRLSDEIAGGIEPAESDRDSVLDHLLRIMDYLASHRDKRTGLVLALYGDWNDAVDGLGTTQRPGREFGTGVSVMASLQLYRNCTEMIELLEHARPDRGRIGHYRTLRAELEAGLEEFAIARSGDQRRILHGWGDERNYFVGGFADSDGHARDSLTSNAFWVLSGMLDCDRSLADDVLAAFARLDSKYGMKTFEPGFAPDAPGVGRVGKLPIGTAENGATYVHATAFGIMALFAMGRPREAWEQIVKVLPFASHQQGLSHSPFVIPNSYVDNPELNLTGQSMNDWQTGSSNVLLKLLIREVFGFRPGIDRLVIAPATWGPFAGFEFDATAHGRAVQIELKRGDVASRRITLNDWPIEMRFDDSRGCGYVEIPYSKLLDGKANRIVVIDPVATPGEGS